MNHPENLESKLIRRTFPVLLLAILLIAAAVRGLDINWDEGTHLHPDERYLTMVVSAITSPTSLDEYWNTAQSPLNPTNRGYGGYVYGTLPLFTTRAVGTFLDGACGDSPSGAAQAFRLALLGTQEKCWPGLYTGYGGIHLVGRALSALIDLLALLGLALLARRLYGEKVALLAAALYALAVLPIQQAHFFVVDSFAGVFVVWTLYFLVRASQTHSRTAIMLAGLMTGLAVASKISVWPLAGMVALTGLFIFLEERRMIEETAVPAIPSDESTDEEVMAAEGDVDAEPVTASVAPIVPRTPKFDLNRAVVTLMAALVLSGGLAFLAFRCAQPYAFSGPGFLNFTIDESWRRTLSDIGNLMSGKVDAPYAHQWTQRLPIVFPWVNMVFWGMGLPLGLTAWMGWAVMAWKLFRKRELEHWIPWIWGTLFFLYQGTQWVKSMRYLLPVYAVFGLFAAWFLVKAAARPWQRVWVHRLMTALPAVVLLGTAVWCWGFLQIYFRPFSRAEASRWMYENLPTAIFMETESGKKISVPIGNGTMLQGPDSSLIVPFDLATDQTIQRVVLYKVDGLGIPGPRRIEASLSLDMGGTPLLARVSSLIETSDVGTVRADLDLTSSLFLPAGRYYFALRLTEGNAVLLDTTVLGNENWDDPLPVSIEGKNAFGDWFRGLQSSSDSLFQMYNDDNADKRSQLFSWLDEVDVIVLSSNRQYGSIPRLPIRYPFTVAYYKALFDGSLGFKLIADFPSYITIGPCQFNDQEEPFGVPSAEYTTGAPCTLPYPTAEEAFSVYDHPRVLIFEKTAAYSRQKTEQLLPASLLDNVRWMTPLQATQGLDKNVSLLLGTDTLKVQTVSGTWSVLFNWNSLQNRYPALAVFLWWLMLTLLGWIAFPWLYLALPALRDRGYGLTRIAGLLLWSYPAWLLASFKWVPHTPLLLWLVFLALAVASGALIYTRRAEFKGFFRVRRSMLIWCEIIFAALYLAWVFFRYCNPDLWHPVAGGEKPMDFAYLNAVIKSVYFPPYDPWFSGGQMNYYYYGMVIIGSVIKVLGIVPAIAYNLAVPSLFALTGVGAYSLVNNLAGSDNRRGHRAGLWGVMLVLLLGNLGELQLLFKGFKEIGGVSFESMIPGYSDMVSAAVGFWKVVVEGQKLSFRPEWWYWNASRVIPTTSMYDPGTINEFPLFTFLYSDLHAHMIAFPLTQLALGVALQWGIAGSHLPDSWRSREPATNRFKQILWWIPRPWPTLILAGLVAGALRATNTWDYPTYLVLMGIAPLLKCLDRSLQVRQPQPIEAEALEGEIVKTPFYQKIPFRQITVLPLIFILAELFFRPYTVNYATSYNSFGTWTDGKTPLGSYFIIYGQLLFPLILLLIHSTGSVVRRLWSIGQEIFSAIALVALGGALLTVVLALFMQVQVAWIAIPMGLAATLVILDESTSPRRRILWFWIGTAMAFSIFVELFVLAGDIGRLNTVFKFYLQVWMLLALGAGVAAERIMSLSFVGEKSSQTAAGGWLQRFFFRFNDLIVGIFAFLLFGAALYPALAIPARAQDRWSPDAPRTLNGMAYMDYVTQYEHGGEISLAVDRRVIRWLQENVPGTPVIMEGQGEREYLWGGRISIYTGLPSVVGWRWHQVQQRSVMPAGMVEARQADVTDFYNTDNPMRAMEILRHYNVGYIILTPYERAYMLPAGLPKFAAMVNAGQLEIVYQESQATVYRVVQ